MTQSSGFKQFVVVHGNENFLIDRDLAKYRSAKRSTLHLDGGSLTEHKLIEYCEATTEHPRTIVVDNVQELGAGKAALKDLKKFIETRDPKDWSLNLVVAFRGGGKLPEVWSAAAEKGVKYERTEAPWWDSDAHINFIVQEAASNRVKIERKTAETLLRYTGLDLYQISNEVRKLALLVGSPGTIAESHIAAVTTRTPHSSSFKVADAALNKELAALPLFTILCNNRGEDEAAITTCAALMSKVEEVFKTKNLQQQGLPDEDISTLLKMKPGKYKNFWVPVVNKHSVTALVKHMGQLCKLNSYVKLGRSKRNRVELAILSILK